jgi:UDPglucose--hexose-1-phosphate uridylyltransferase
MGRYTEPGVSIRAAGRFVNANSPEYRTCPLTGRVVIVAPERGLRPQALPARPATEAPGDCPFCPGNEHDTPGETYAVRRPGSRPNGPGWDLRVVPNKFPAVRPTLTWDGLPEAGHGVPGFGVHELILDTPRHVADPVEYTPAEWLTLLTAYRDRVAAILATPGIKSVTLFKNVGAAAGASLAHAHSQAVGLPFVPPELATRVRLAAEYHARSGRFLLHDHIAAERLVTETEHFAVVTAFAPRFAYELIVAPKAHQARFPECGALAELADVLRRVLVVLQRVLGGGAYNWCLHTAPANPVDATGFVWHLEILPRTANVAGFEWGSGCFLTTVRPEVAAARLREALP